jgi:hypothetical protein
MVALVPEPAAKKQCLYYYSTAGEGGPSGILTLLAESIQQRLNRI